MVKHHRRAFSSLRSKRARTADKFVQDVFRIRRNSLTAKSNSSTAFPLPVGMLATVDLLCHQQDLTRSQVYRRSITEYLKNQQVEVVEPMRTDQPRTWSEEL
jgi:hypothetical protein